MSERNPNHFETVTIDVGQYTSIVQVIPATGNPEEPIAGRFELPSLKSRIARMKMATGAIDVWMGTRSSDPTVILFDLTLSDGATYTVVVPVAEVRSSEFDIGQFARDEIAKQKSENPKRFRPLDGMRTKSGD